MALDFLLFGEVDFFGLGDFAVLEKRLFQFNSIEIQLNSIQLNLQTNKQTNKRRKKRERPKACARDERGCFKERFLFTFSCFRNSAASLHTTHKVFQESSRGQSNLPHRFLFSISVISCCG